MCVRASWICGAGCGWAAVITCFPTVLASPTRPTVTVTTIPVHIDRRTIAMISAAAKVVGTMKIGDPIWVSVSASCVLRGPT